MEALADVIPKPLMAETQILPASPLLIVFLIYIVNGAIFTPFTVKSKPLSKFSIKPLYALTALGIVEVLSTIFFLYGLKDTSAIREEFENRVAHIKTRSLKDGFVNRPIERYHNEIREKLKARRGLGNDKSAQTFSELLKINHNFVKPHEGLDGKTPAQVAGIELNLGDDKYMDLIKQAGIKPNFVNNLGKRLKKVSIVNEGDSIKVTPTGWIDKAVWREINDILKLYQFSWLSNGKDSCWMKLLS